MKKLLITFSLFFIFIVGINAQDNKDRLDMPVFGIKTNLAYWATTTPNLGIEFALARKATFDISANYNPFTFSDGKKFKHWLIQPEIRYWFCDRFYRHFIGFHGHYAEFNACDIRAIGKADRRYEGNLYGGGISYGYHWVIKPHFSIEATLGIGYAHIKYDKYECGDCGPYLDTRHRNYVGPTKVGLNFIYIIK